MDRSSAKKWTIAAQGLAGAGALALAGAAIVSVPGGAIEQPPVPGAVVLPDITSSDPSGTDAAPTRTDGTATAARLARVANHPKRAETAAPTQPTPVEVPPPAAASPSISYLGAVTMGTRKRALLRLDGGQRFVSLGDKVSDKPVEKIEDEFVMIGGTKYTLLERSGSRLSLASARPRPVGILQPRALSTPQIVKPQRGDAAAFGAGMQSGNMMLDGYVQVPEFVAPEDAMLWRRVRAEMIEAGKYDPREIDRIAAKMIEERRGAQGEELEMTQELREAERRFIGEYGQGSKKEKQ
jgi:hypothetical protein